jgi:hypothetical protein
MKFETFDTSFSGMSVIVNTCDRARYLRDCLQSLARQSIAIEVIVVNGPSADDTEMVCRAYPQVVYRQCGERNLSKSRNIGIAAARGDVIAFIDDDAVAHEDWAKNLLGAYTDERVGGAGGFTLDNTGRAFQSRHLVSDWRGDSWSFENEASAGVLTGSTEHYTSVLGANCSFRRADLVRIGGFDEVYAYFLDETDICARLARIDRAIRTVPSAVVLHRYAPSHVRNENRLSTSLLATIRSKIYFCYKFARPSERGLVNDYVSKFLNEQDFSLKWHIHRAKYSAAEFFRLQAEVRQGADEGRALAVGDAVSRDCLLPRTIEEEARGGSPRELLGGKIQGRTRIAFVSQGYPPADTNGIARWTRTIAEAAARHGHTVHVVTRSTNGQSATEYIDGVWIHSHSGRPSSSLDTAPVDLPDSILQNAICVRHEVLRIQKLWGLDVVSGPIWDVEAILCHAIDGVKAITSLHTTYALMRPYKFDWRFNPQYDQNHVQPVIEAERWLIENSSLLVANSRSVIKEISEHYAGVDPARSLIVPHGFDPPEAVTRKPSAGLKRVVFVGRVEQRKGVDLLLKAALAIDSIFKLQIVGADAPDGTAYSALVDELVDEIRKRRNIDFERFGFVDDGVLDRVYRDAAVVVVPSRYESFGLVVIEAMGRGVPVIVADVGGMSEIVTDGEDGLKFATEDYRSLQDCLERLLTDEELRQRLGVNARKTFEMRYTADQMVRSFFAFSPVVEDTAHA